MTSDDDDGEGIDLDRRFITEWDPLLELSRDEMIEAVRQAILSLPPHYREVVVLCNLHEMSYDQAAGIIGCPIGTVRSRLNRARAMLVEKMYLLKEAGAAARTSMSAQRCLTAWNDPITRPNC